MIFIDTGGFLARSMGRDQFHRQALTFWDELAEKRERLVTSNFVLDELTTLLGRRAGHQFAGQRLHSIYTSAIIDIVRPDREDELRALDLFIKYADQAVSYTDCISFTLMKQYHIRHVFTFDHHFSLAGFLRLPD